MLGIIRSSGPTLKTGISIGGDMRLLAAVLIFVSTSMQASIEAPGLSDREYRYLTLPNALKVLLISDPTTDKAAVSMCDELGVSAPATPPPQAQSLETQNLETPCSPQGYSPQTEPLHRTTPLWVQRPETEMRIAGPRGLSMCSALKTGE